MTEDHCLCNSQAAVQIAERCELVLLIPTKHVELFDGVQRLLLSFQSDDIRLCDHSLSKIHHRVLKGRREEQHLTAFTENPPVDTDALVPMALHGDHHVGFVQHKHCDLLGVNELVLGAPVQDCAWCPNDNLLLQLDASRH
uniref:Uncharacterized protein n=1 Tax=Fundulus heteroclitus TaxID=8078 RepID=A0A3Q2QG48_FUNHE